MHYTHIIANKLHEGVKTAMQALDNGQMVVGENQDEQVRLKEISLLMEIRDCKDITISKTMPTDLYGLVEYELEFIDGVRDFEPSWEYTYHRLFNPFLSKCINELKRNPSTRRAVLPIAGTLSYGNAHPPCLQEVLFKVKNNKLNTTAVFRSNDGVKAFQMNVFAIIRLANIIAEEIGVEIGTYTHIANSFHAYETDWDKLYKYCQMLNANNNPYTLEEYFEVYEEYAPEYIEKCKKRYEEVGQRQLPNA